MVKLKVLKGGLKINKMNKKFYVLGIPLLALALVSAALFVQYGFSQQDVEVISPITAKARDRAIPMEAAGLTP